MNFVCDFIFESYLKEYPLPEVLTEQERWHRQQVKQNRLLKINDRTF